MTFRAKDFLPATVLAGLTDVRVSEPERSLQVAKERKRRDSLTVNGRLNILAADHPARRVTRVGDNPLRMADRHEYMARILRVMMSETVDGLLATMDILEDLLIIHDLMHRAGGPAFLNDKLLIVGATWIGCLVSPEKHGAESSVSTACCKRACRLRIADCGLKSMSLFLNPQSAIRNSLSARLQQAVLT